MIRGFENSDAEAIFVIINENWRTVYSGYVDPALVSHEGCMRRNGELVRDFVSKRFSEYVWEENREVRGMISFGKTGETDCSEAFEIWRLYVAKSAQGQGIGSALLEFAETAARERGFREMVIWTFKENKRALEFYQKHGCTIDKEIFLEKYKAVGVRLKKTLQ